MSKLLKHELPVMELCLTVRSPRKTYTPMLVNHPGDVSRWLEPVRMSSEERFVAVHLNSRHEIIGLHEISHGTLVGSLVHPREVFKCALLANSYAMILAHNHPSGSRLTPSPEDLETTRELIAVGKQLGLPVIDHLILSPVYDYYSIRDHHDELWEE